MTARCRTGADARPAATLPLDWLESPRIVEHGAAILAAAGVPAQAAVTAIQAVGQLTSGSVSLEAFWREWAGAGRQVRLAPPMLPHPELPALSRAAAEARFLSPQDVFESGLSAVITSLEPLADGPAAAPPPRP